ncbi:MAG: hypothetical protein LAT61_15240 [Alcanivorax sp.]|nr:hypothetical protein [Alcanivorax sp.]
MSTSDNSTRLSPLKGLLPGLIIAAALTACGGSSSSSAPRPISPEGMTAVIATVDAGYQSGEVELIDLDAEAMTASGGYHATISDISVSSYGQHYYLIERYQGDRIGKVDISNPAVFDWQYSTVSEDDTESANPYELIFVDDEKAYLVRYDSTTAWVVNPSATREEDFRIGELDLSAYSAGGATTPRMSAGILIGDRLFLAMQRLDSSWQPSHDGYVAVFDINTDTEIDTEQGEDGLKGIPLISRNPLSMAYQPELGLFVQGAGAYFSSTHSGGIDVIDVDDFSVSQLLAASDDTGQIDSIAVRDAETAYITIYNGGMRRINPQTGDILGAIDAVSATDIRSLAFDPLGRLWVADATMAAPGLRVINPDDDSQVAFIATDLLPSAITFVVEE